MFPSETNPDTNSTGVYSELIKSMEDKILSSEKALALSKEELQKYTESGQEDEAKRKRIETKIFFYNSSIQRDKTRLEGYRQSQKQIDSLGVTETKEMREANNKALESLQAQVDQYEKESKNENKPQKLPIKENNCISMHVFSLFVTTLGIAAIATAFIFLNAASFGTAGLLVAGIGLACTFAGIGMFTSNKAAGSQLVYDDILDDSASYTY